MTIQTNTKNDAASEFLDELRYLKRYLQIPGLVIIIVKNEQVLLESYLGTKNRSDSIGLDTDTIFDVDSLTNICYSVLTAKFVKAGLLTPEDTMEMYLPDLKLSNSIKINHLLNYTNYNSIGKAVRRHLLIKIIEQVSDQSIESCIREMIFKPFLMTNSSVEPQRYVSERANPHLDYSKAIEDQWRHDHLASPRIMTCARDVKRFYEALDLESTEHLIWPSKHSRHVLSGIYSQNVAGEEVVWCSSQNHRYSDLFIKVPDKNLSLILLANSSRLTDSARLYHGDITNSSFALSFLKNYVLDHEFDQTVKTTRIVEQDATKSYLHRKIILAEAQAASYMSQHDRVYLDRSIDLLNENLTLFPHYLQYANYNLLYNLNFIRRTAAQLNLPPVHQFDTHIAAISDHLFKKSVKNKELNISDFEPLPMPFTTAPPQEVFRTQRATENWSKEIVDLSAKALVSHY